MFTISIPEQELRQLERNLDKAFASIEKEVNKALVASGQLLQGEMRRSIARGIKTGDVYQKYNPRREHRASAPGQAPASDTGRLANSIQMQPDLKRNRVDVVVDDARVEYAKFLEYGTATIQERPFMRPAIKKHRRRIEKAMREAIKRGVNNAKSK